MKNIKLLLLTLVCISAAGLNAMNERFTKPTGTISDYNPKAARQSLVGRALRPCADDLDCPTGESCAADATGKVAGKLCVRRSTAFGTAAE